MRGGRGNKSCAAILAVGALLLGATGCGSDEGETALTKSEFLKQGNQICREGRAERAKAVDQVQKEASGKESSEQAFAATVQAAVPSMRATNQELAELEPPEQEQEKVDSMIDGLEAAVDQLEGVAEGSAEAREGKAVITVARKLNAYGLDDCSI
jgi:hypothetical protein